MIGGFSGAEYLVKRGKSPWFAGHLEVKHNDIIVTSRGRNVSEVIIPVSCLISVTYRNSKLILTSIPKIDYSRSVVEISLAGEAQSLLKLSTFLNSKIPKAGGAQEERKLLVYINPFAGTGVALAKWDVVQKILKKAGVRTHVIRTKSQNHALNHLRKADLSEYSGVVSVSGDGLAHEVLNGLYGRDDWNQIRNKFNFGIVPGGSGNAIHCSLLYQMKESFNDEVIVSALNLARGKSVDADYIMCETENRKFLSMFGVSWGLIPDCDINSEVIRWAGFMRVYIFLILRLLSPRYYGGRVHFLPSNDKVKEIPELPKIGDPVPKNWTTVEGDFLIVYACKQSWLDYSTIFVPDAKLDDGIIYLVVCRAPLSLRESIKLLLNPSARDLHSNIFIVPVSAFRIEINNPNDPLTVDAEKLTCRTVQGRIVSPGCKMLVNLTDK